MPRPYDVRIRYMRNRGRQNGPAVMEHAGRTVRLWATDAQQAREIARERFNAYVVDVHDVHG